MIFFLLVYVAEGLGQVGGLVSQPLAYFLKTALGWNAERVAEYLALLTIPWVIKPIYGLLSDFIPIFGYRRKSYLFLANCVATGAFLLLTRVTNPAQIFLGLLLTCVGMAAASTISGAVLVENGKLTGLTGKFVGQQWLWFSIAGVFTALVGGWLCTVVPPTAALHTAVLITAFAPVGVIVGVWFLIDEPKTVRDMTQLRQSTQGLLNALRSKTLWLVAFFLAMWQFSPGSGTPLYYHMVNRLHYSQGFIGTLGAIGSVGSVVGALLFMYWLQDLLSLRSLIYVSLLLGVTAQAAYVLLSTPMSAIILAFFTATATQIAMLTMLTLAADACPDKSEGFSYALLMSIFNLSAQGSAIVGSALYVHWFHNQLNPLILTGAGFTSLCVLLVPLLPRIETKQVETDTEVSAYVSITKTPVSSCIPDSPTKGNAPAR